MPPTPYHTPITGSGEIAAGPVSMRAAVLGGVMGSMSAIAMLGLVALFFWKCHRKRESKEPEKFLTGSFSFMQRSRTEEEWRDRGTPKLPEITVSTTPIIEDNLIRMSLAHWDRPYAHDDPFRDKDEELTLRVTNPDPIRSPSPLLPPNDSPRRFMQRQRTALAAALANFKRTASSQSLAQNTPPRQASPMIADHLSQDLRIPPTALLAGSMLRTSQSQSPEVVSQKPPVEPFLHPQSNTPRPIRPPIRHVASRTPSYNDRPFTMLSSKAVETQSRSPSPDTLSFNSYSNRRYTDTSDPFEIDPRGYRARDGDTPNWSVHAYEET